MRFALPLLLLAMLPASAAELPVRSVILSNAGLMQIERSGPLAPDAPLTFRVPLDDVDDVTSTMTFSPPWTPDRMSEDAKFALGY